MGKSAGPATRGCTIEINYPIVGALLVVATIAIVLVCRSFRAPVPPQAGKGQSEPPTGARELETKIRMASGPIVVNDLQRLALIYVKAGQHDEAEGYCRQALQIAEEHYGESNEALIPILRTYARILKEMKRHVEAADMLKRAEHCATKR